jgi:hypothetical protein
MNMEDSDSLRPHIQINIRYAEVSKTGGNKKFLFFKLYDLPFTLGAPFLPLTTRMLRLLNAGVNYVKTHVIDVNTSHTPEEGAHSPIRWPNGLTITIVIYKPARILTDMPI